MGAAAWWQFAADQPDLAAAGEALLRAFTIGYLATLRADGAPRIHPVTVTLHSGGLYVFTIASSRKTADLRRDPRFALHAFPRFPDADGWSDDELSLGGTATEIRVPDLRDAVRRVHNDAVGDSDPLWELGIERAFHKVREGGAVLQTTWTAPGSRGAARP